MRFKMTVSRLWIAVCGLLLADSPLLAAEFRVLTGDPGTTQTGQWAAATGASDRLEGRPGLYAISGSGSTYTLAPNLSMAGEYTVEVFNNCYSPRAHNASHIIHHAGGAATHVIEQDCARDDKVGQWRRLGSYHFNAGNQGRVVVDTTGADNSYVGVTGVRFLSAAADNQAPSLTLSSTVLTVGAGEPVALSAVASDPEDGNITGQIVWTSPVGGGEGGSFFALAGSAPFGVTASVADASGASATRQAMVNVVGQGGLPGDTRYFSFDSECDGSLNPLAAFTTNNASALPEVGADCGNYLAQLASNANDITLHFNDRQGRFDGIQVQFPFVVTARGVGIAPFRQPGQPHSHPTDAYMFAGIQVHHADLNSKNSAHVVVGQRGSIRNTIEGKQTRNAVSQQDDVGNQAVPSGRADIRIVGNVDRTLKVYWQPHVPGMPDAWIPYEAPRAGRPPGVLRGAVPDWDDTVYVGLITYAFGSAGVPFTGVMDSLEVIQN